MVYNFLKLNHDLSINGIKLNEIICLELPTVNEYLENVVLMHKEDARSVVTMAMPLVLRVNISIVIFMANDTIKSDSCVETYESKNTSFGYAPLDSLDFHEETISVMLRPGHYDILYKNDYYSNTLKIYEGCYMPCELVDNQAVYIIH